MDDLLTSQMQSNSSTKYVLNFLSVLIMHASILLCIQDFTRAE